MKFVHIADLHFDRPFISLNGNKALSKKRKLEQKLNLQKVIDYIKENDVKFLFLSGDLYEHKFVSEDSIKFLISCINQIPQTQVFIAPGNHDPLINTSPYKKYQFPPNVHIFDSKLKHYDYGDIIIYGIGFENYYMEKTDFSAVSLDSLKCNILVTHGTLNGASGEYHDIKESEISNFDYVALGHIHQKKIDSSKIIYPGSLTSCGFDEPGEHGMVVGTIEKNEADLSYKIDYKFIKVDETEFERVTIDASDINSMPELISKLPSGDNIYKIILKGDRNFDMSNIEEEIKLANPNVCAVENETHIKYDLEAIAREDTLKGVFTKKILEEIKSNPQEEKRYMGALKLVYKYMI